MAYIALFQKMVVPIVFLQERGLSSGAHDDRPLFSMIYIFVNMKFLQIETVGFLIHAVSSFAGKKGF